MGRIVKVMALTGAGWLTLSCGGGGGGSSPAAPAAVAADPPISVSASPNAGNVVWEYGPGLVVPSLTPRISWSARVKAPISTSELWVAVRLLNSAGTMSCFQSAFKVGQATSGSFYSASGDTWALVGTATFYQNPCGDSFTTTLVDVQMTDGAPFSSAPRVAQAQQFAATYNFTRTGYAGGPPQPSPTPSPRPSGTPQPPSGPYPACPGTPPSAACGQATGRCNNGDYTCSQNRQGTCSSNGGIQCVFCPGPIC